MDEAGSFLAAVTAWGRRRPDVHAALLIGSHARSQAAADQWSDIDLVLVVDQPATYLDDASWLGAFGQPLLTFLEPTAVGGFTERRVLFATGQDVDFALLPLTAAHELAGRAELGAVLGRGFRVLVDKLGVERTLREAGDPAPPHASPSAATFAQVTHDFWYHALWAARKLRRGEVWMAKQGCNCHLKALLVQLLAWDSQARDRRIDTWHGGRFLERWADGRVLDDLRVVDARYDARDVARALRATVDLFEQVELRCAERLGLEPTVPHRRIRRLLDAVLSEGDPGAA
jgi:aminoglycoside 6-adenylyltransferase